MAPPIGTASTSVSQIVSVVGNRITLYWNPTHFLFQADDYGKYTCIAANALGRDAESMYLYRKYHKIKQYNNSDVD